MILVFVLGACVGSFLNVCIYRLPFDKSVLWPGSRCSHCLKSIKWYDNIPLVSYWLLGGRCRFCRTRFSIRYFFIELSTALIFVGLFYVEVIANVYGLDEALLGTNRFNVGRGAIFTFHALLVSLLLAASVCDYDHHIIPLQITVSGTIFGLIGALLFPWPWPYLPAEAEMAAGAMVVSKAAASNRAVPVACVGTIARMAGAGRKLADGIGDRFGGNACRRHFLAWCSVLFRVGNGSEIHGSASR